MKISRYVYFIHQESVNEISDHNKGWFDPAASGETYLKSETGILEKL